MRPATQQGFSIIAAIFILVVLAALGAFMVTIYTNQQIGFAMDVQGSRAYQAARSGIEWGVFKVQWTAAYRFGYTALGVATDPDLRSCGGGSGSFTFPASATTLSDYTVTVTCTEIPPDAFSSPKVFQVIAVACNQPSGGNCPNTTDPGSFYIERRLEVVF